MVAWDSSSRRVSVVPERRQAPSRGTAAPERESRWQALGRILYAAALASAMTDPQIITMMARESLETGTDGR